ncbi:MAG TPA: glycoside hydrolase family 30 beta sandwich domain-containing protein [Bacteroidales bacterium]|nr:glycoside hydrolase family 30 beta sandwich domain-containing protein [Bacteroidales bacterium]
MASNVPDDLPNEASFTPDGNKVLIVMNNHNKAKDISVVWRGKFEKINLAIKIRSNFNMVDFI